MRWILDGALVGLLSTLALGSAEAQHASRDAIVAAHAASSARRPPGFPAPRGASLARAERLGLGDADVARALLHRPPSAALVRAARRGPNDHDTLLWPVDDGRFGRGFGYVRRTDRGRRHDGVDLVAPRGAVIRAAADGLVAYSGDGIRGFGNVAVLVHPNGWVTVYAHTDRVTVPTGYRVRRGERIGFVGSTGISQGPHLHFELIVDGRAVDPMDRFEGDPWVEARARWDAGELAHSRDHLGALAPDYTTESGPSTAVPPAAPPAAARETLRAPTGLAEARALLREAPSPDALAAIDLPTYSTLLWPLRGGSLASDGATSHDLRIAGEAGAAVRAAADGRVIYAGDALDGYGRAVVLLHANGWVTVYGGLGEIAARPGEIALRGSWIGKLSGDGPTLRFRLLDGGQARDPSALLVQAPGATADALP